jgi:hypothetical protein
MLNKFEIKKVVGSTSVECALRTGPKALIAKIGSMGADGDYTYSSITCLDDVDTGERYQNRRFMESVGSVIMLVRNDLRGFAEPEFYQVSFNEVGGLEPLYGCKAIREALAGGVQPTVASTDNCYYQNGCISISFRDTAGGDGFAQYLVVSEANAEFEMICDTDDEALDVDEDGLELLALQVQEFLNTLTKQRTLAREQDEARRLEARADELGCSAALVRYLESLEHRIGRTAGA